MRYYLEMFFRRASFLFVPLFLALACGGSSGSGDSGGDPLTQCEIICSHLYSSSSGDCDTSYDLNGTTLTESECVDDCATFSTAMADCLETVTCTESAISDCFALDSGGGGTPECVVDDDCSSGEVCTDGSCVADTSNLCGGDVCTAGCCEGSVCCGGAFCGGDCVGTPCCD